MYGENLHYKIIKQGELSNMIKVKYEDIVNDLKESIELKRLSNEIKSECIKIEDSKSKFYCFIMNIIDFRYWFCNCHYYSPYGLVISADACKKHN